MAVSQSGRAMSPFTTCGNTGGLSLGTPRAHPPTPSLCGPHLMHHPVSRHDHQRIPAAQFLGLHQLPGVVPPLCGETEGLCREEGVTSSGCSLHPLGEALTREYEREGDISLGQEGLHVAPEELQGLALAPTRVEQHQHAAGPWEQAPGTTGCKNKPTKVQVSNRPLGG